MRRALVALSLFVLAATRASAQEEPFALVQREVVTDWVASAAVSRWATADGADEADDDALDLARDEARRAAREVRAAGGRVVWSARRLLPLRGGDLELADRGGVMARRVRRRARVDLLVAGPAPEGAVALSARATVELELVAAGERAWGERGPDARQARRRLTVAEMAQLERDPTAFGRTAAGAALAATLERLAAGAEEPDALELRATARAIDLRAADGSALELADAEVSSEKLDAATGRRRPLGARLRAALGRAPAPQPRLSADDAALLERALGAALSEADWRRLLDLRRASPAALGEAERAFLRGATAAPPPAPPPPVEPRRGLVDAF